MNRLTRILQTHVNIFLCARNSVCDFCRTEGLSADAYKGYRKARKKAIGNAVVNPFRFIATCRRKSHKVIKVWINGITSITASQRQLHSGPEEMTDFQKFFHGYCTTAEIIPVYIISSVTRSVILLLFLIELSNITGPAQSIIAWDDVRLPRYQIRRAANWCEEFHLSTLASVWADSFRATVNVLHPNNLSCNVLYKINNGS